MKGFEKPEYIIYYLVCNAIGVLLFVLAVKKPLLGKNLLAIVFILASAYNFKMALYTPEAYLTFAPVAIKPYRNFIEGWFSNNVQMIVFIIAFVQALTGIGFLLQDLWFRMSSISAFIFFVAIAPLGIGSAFPFTLILAVAVLFVLKNYNQHYKVHYRITRPKKI